MAFQKALVTGPSLSPFLLPSSRISDLGILGGFVFVYDTQVAVLESRAFSGAW